MPIDHNQAFTILVRAQKAAPELKYQIENVMDFITELSVIADSFEVASRDPVYGESNVKILANRLANIRLR